ncbi:hypothetical protein HUR95_16020 [Caldalkalibacillus thermarum TA2.A1]|uniref:Uncharacterized protein n=1 Tax=Caldalkalibacillus thermarum (strain TA2.A1) TaxID=986075 RepID=A0A8X8I3G1_CALTT|nr:hypothetical protein [Caldalkalibacillus thermarum]QZT33705.1 hypothetical protein HUR95_16020 [Caldalkalibacillus thermarum TA2.A1]
MRTELYTRWLEGLKWVLYRDVQSKERYEQIKEVIPCKVEWQEDFDYPVLLVEYPGMMPHYDEYMKMKGKIRDIYQHSFNLANLHVPQKHIFEQAHVFIVHYFQNRIIRDLDNRYTNFIINNLRYAGYVPDDDWQHVWWTEIGLLGEKEKVQMYVVEVNRSGDFYTNYLMELRNRSLTIAETQENETTFEEHMLNLSLGKNDKDYDGYDDDPLPRKRNPKLKESLF